MVGIIIGGVFAVLILVVLIRTLMFRPYAAPETVKDEVEVDPSFAAENLAALIRCKTVSHRDTSLEDRSEFLRFESVLKERFPTVISNVEYENVGDRAILMHWRGKDHTSPTVLMAHFDVVSADEAEWQKPPFDGVIEDGVLWGRGTIDTKGSLNGALCAAELLLKEGFVPEHDIYFSFASDEEVNGHGAADVVALFKERGIEPGLVLDEGGAVIDGIFPGVKLPCAVIGIAEKGMVNIEYTVSCNGGHSSAPKRHTPVGLLSRACVRVEGHPFKFRLTSPTKQMMDTLGRHSTFVYRMIFGNLWLFAPVLNLIGKKQGGQINAIARTTVAFTKMQGSDAINVIPPHATICSNSRILPGESVEGTAERIRRTVNDENVSVRVINGNEPSRVSRTDVPAYAKLKSVINSTWPDAVVSPYLMIACSDARVWGEISDKVYRFSPMRLTKEENDMIHGNDERLPVSKIAEVAEFYVRLIKKC